MKFAIPNVFFLTYRLFLPVSILFFAILALVNFIKNYEIKLLLFFVILFPLSICWLLKFTKIKFLWVDKKGMYWVYLFSFKKDQILWNQPHNVNYSAKSLHKSEVYRKVKIKNKENVEIVFTDFDFYNFNKLTSYVKNGKNQRNKVNLEYAMYTKSYQVVILLFQIAFLMYFFIVSYQHMNHKTYFIIPMYFIILIINSSYKVIWCYITNKAE